MATIKPATLETTAINGTYPVELQQLKQAYDEAWGAFAKLDALEAANIRERGDMGERNALRELAVEAYKLMSGINELGTVMLGKWDADNCTWKRNRSPHDCASCGYYLDAPGCEIVIPGAGPYAGQRICGECFTRIYPEEYEGGTQAPSAAWLNALDRYHDHQAQAERPEFPTYYDAQGREHGEY